MTVTRPFKPGDDPLLSEDRRWKLAGRAIVAGRVGAVVAVVLQDADSGARWALFWDRGPDGGTFRVTPVE